MASIQSKINSKDTADCLFVCLCVDVRVFAGILPFSDLVCAVFLCSWDIRG